MKQYQSSDIRNFAIVGHGASGKTCFSEAMLKLGGEINRLGKIEDGTTTSDYHPGEKDRQISIHATPLHMEWMDKKFNMIDTPGYSDFTGESFGSLNVVDLSVITIHSCNGVEVGTESMWNQATKLGIPKMLVINGFLLGVVSYMVKGFHVEGFWPAVGGAVIISLVSGIMNLLVSERGHVEVAIPHGRSGRKIRHIN